MCLNPIKTKNSPDPVPCGKCPECRNRRATGWAFRILQEYKKATTAHFLTLTYDETRVPRNNDTGYATLNKSDVQNFIKRLRKYSKKGTKKIRYYAVGEYGSETQRPHYHIIIFNAKTELIEKAWSYEDSKKARANRTRSLRGRKRSKCGLHAQVYVQTKKNNKTR